MKYKLEFRPIQKEDNPEMANVIRTVMTEFGTVGEGYSINDPEVDGMYEAYDNEKSVFFVITSDGVVKGGGGIAPLLGGDPEICELKKMYFQPEIRGLGFGKVMVTKCLEEAKRMGYKKCYLETVVRMEAANKLYQKLGFKKLEGAMGNTGHSSCEAWYVMDL